MFHRLALLVFPVLLFTAIARADPLAPDSVPGPLKPWTDWVLHGHEDRSCPQVQGNSEERRCAWPTTLELVLDDRAGRFALKARVYAESWLPPPGGVEHWPQQVEVDGKAAVVATADNTPGIHLAPGEHTVKGRFVWGRNRFAGGPGWVRRWTRRRINKASSDGLVKYAGHQCLIGIPSSAALA